MSGAGGAPVGKRLPAASTEEHGGQLAKSLPSHSSPPGAHTSHAALTLGADVGPGHAAEAAHQEATAEAAPALGALLAGGRGARS